jgi:hypothetical protein
MLTDAQLQGIGAQCLNIAKRDLNRGGFNFLLAAYHESDVPPLHRMNDIEALTIERLGEDWLNNGSTKDLGFRVLRMAVDMLPPDAVVIVTICNYFSPTAKLLARPLEEQQELANQSHDRHHEAVRKGLMEVCDMLLATVQTPERVCFYQQKLNRRGEFIDKPETRCLPQEEFNGRVKMFGAHYATT